MSFKAAAWAIENDVVQTTAQKLVLVVLADAHNGQTGRCFPTHERIAENSRLSISQTKRILKQLESLGLITKKPSRGRGRASEYILHIKGSASEPFYEEEKGSLKGPTHDPLKIKGFICDDKRVHLEQEKGSPMTPLPGINQEYNQEERASTRICPSDFVPDEYFLRTARFQQGVDVDAELFKFKNHEFAQSKTDWNRAFVKWLAGAKPARKENDERLSKLERETNELLGINQ